MSREFHPLVKRVLDGELTLAELPAELRAEAAEASRLLQAVDRRSVELSPALEARVMAAVRHRATSPGARAWHWFLTPSIPPWAVGTLAVAATLVLFLFRSVPMSRPATSFPAATVTGPESAYVKFVLFAPTAHRVAIAGTFNRWDPSAAPMTRLGGDGVWSVTLPLATGQHQYAFVVDGREWRPDPAAPRAASENFGQPSSVIVVGTRAS